MASSAASSSSKENNNNNTYNIPSHHRQSLCFASSLRSPLSPVHHNLLLHRPLPCTPSSRRFHKPLFLPPPPPSPPSNPPSSSSSSSSAVPLTPLLAPRRFLKDASASASSAAMNPPLSRSRASLKDRFLPPSSSSSSNHPKTSIPPPHPWKRHTHNFLPISSHQDPISSSSTHPVAPDLTHHKSCRRKWRRFSRDTVLRSLRGDANPNDREVRLHNPNSNPNSDAVSTSRPIVSADTPLDSAPPTEQGQLRGHDTLSKSQALAMKAIADVRSIPATDLLSRYRVENLPVCGAGLPCNQPQYEGIPKGADSPRRSVLPPLFAISEETPYPPLTVKEDSSSAFSGDDHLTVTASPVNRFIGQDCDVVVEFPCSEDTVCELTPASPPMETLDSTLNAEGGDRRNSNQTQIVAFEETRVENCDRSSSFDPTLAPPHEEALSSPLSDREDFGCLDEDVEHGAPTVFPPSVNASFSPLTADDDFSTNGNGHGDTLLEAAMMMVSINADASLANGLLCGDSVVIPSDQRTLASPLKADCGHGGSTITPPFDKSAALPDRNLTPPMQETQSPDFIKRDGMRALLPIDGKCYAAPCGTVQDRRKCKPRAVLTVDGVPDPLSSGDSSGEGSAIEQSAMQMPLPAVASVEWMLEEKKRLGDGGTSPDVMSRTSADLCRMSLPRILSPQFEPETGVKDCDDDGGNEKGLQLLQASISVLGYEWGASSSSQGVLRHTELSAASFNRSIDFDDGGAQQVKKEADGDNHLEMCRSSVMSSFVRLEGIGCLNTLYEDLCGEDMISQEAAETCPLFECSAVAKVADEVTEEELLSISGPLSSSVSSQNQDHDAKLNADSIRTGSFQAMQGKKPTEYVWPLAVPAELYHNAARGDISSRIAMARFLCNITATYLDDIASCLEKSGMDSSMTAKEWEEIESFRHDHSSILAGQRKMEECCSLLKDLALEACRDPGGESAKQAPAASAHIL